MPAIAPEELTSLVKKLVAMIDALLEANQKLSTQAQQMRDEIAVLKLKIAKATNSLKNILEAEKE